MFSKELTFCYQGKFGYNETKYQCILMNSVWLYKVSNKLTVKDTEKNIIMLNYETRKRKKKIGLRKMEYIQTTPSIPGLLQSTSCNHGGKT